MLDAGGWCLVCMLMVSFGWLCESARLRYYRGWGREEARGGLFATPVRFCDEEASCILFAAHLPLPRLRAETRRESGERRPGGWRPSTFSSLGHYAMPLQCLHMHTTHERRGPTVHRGLNVKSQNTFSILNISSYCSVLCMKMADVRDTFAVFLFCFRTPHVVT